MNYSKIKVELSNGDSEEFRTIAGFNAVAPINESWNFYDSKGVLHSWNWNMIKKITVTQTDEK